MDLLCFKVKGNTRNLNIMVEIIIDMAYADKYLESIPDTTLYINLTSMPMGTAKKSKFILILLNQRIISSGIKGVTPQYPSYT
jgi:hypothetical protein